MYMSKKYKRVQTPKVALFLGAGASRAFDYPTTKEFLTNFGKTLDGVFTEVVGAFQKFKKVYDIEHILRICDVFIDLNSNELIAEILRGYPPILLRELKMIKLTWDDFINVCSYIKKEAIKALYTQYQFDEGKVSKIVSLYGRLFEDLVGFNRNGRLDIFTTNYDSVVEEFCENAEIDVNFIDGFIPSPRSKRLFWRPKKAFEMDFSKDAVLKLRLFKLHGSLNWGERNKGNIEKVIETQVEDFPRYRRNVLIYPAQKTYEEEEPFSVLYKYFRDASKTSRVFIVIGFSFRDDLINGIFVDHLRAHPRHRLIVVSPNATKNVEENLLQGKKRRLAKKIAIIDQEFGKDETFELLEKRLKLETTRLKLLSIKQRRARRTK